MLRRRRRGFGLWGQRFFARDNRAACERRLQTDRAGAASGMTAQFWVLNWLGLIPGEILKGNKSPWRFLDLGQNHFPITLLADRSDETVGDRGVVLDRIESASPIMLGPRVEWRNLTTRYDESALLSIRNDAQTKNCERRQARNWG